MAAMATKYEGEMASATVSRIVCPPAQDYRQASKRVGADDLPAVALAELLAFLGAHRPGAMQELLDITASGGRSVEKHDAAGLAAGALPGMRDVAREERARARPADAHLVADHERDLAGQHPGDLVAVPVQMKETLGADGHGFLEQHDALIGLVAEELQRGEAAGRSHLEMLSGASGNDKALGGVHPDVLSCGTSRRR